MEMSKQEYQKFVQARAKSSPLVKDCVLAFVIGGGICAVGQAIMFTVAGPVIVFGVAASVVYGVILMLL